MILSLGPRKVADSAEKDDQLHRQSERQTPKQEACSGNANYAGAMPQTQRMAWDIHGRAI